MSESINTVVLFVAGSCFAFSALFYNLYQKKKEELIKLKASVFLSEYVFNINACVTMCLFKFNLFPPFFLLTIQEIPVFRPDQQLVQVLLASPHKRLQYVAVEGKH